MIAYFSATIFAFRMDAAEFPNLNLQSEQLNHSDYNSSAIASGYCALDAIGPTH